MAILYQSERVLRVMVSNAVHWFYVEKLDFLRFII